MAENETEEEQIRAIKEWWNENGRSVVAGVVIGIATLVGWKGWTTYQEQQRLEASDRYNAMRSSILAKNIEGVIAQSEELKEKYASTPYASLAALLAAKAQSEKDNSTAVIENLQWAIDHSKQETIKTLAKLRLARVYIAVKEFDKADVLLSQNYMDSYMSLLHELKGDLHAGRGNLSAAREAYNAAIAAAESEDIEYLKMKRDDLGVVGQSKA